MSFDWNFSSGGEESGDDNFEEWTTAHSNSNDNINNKDNSDDENGWKKITSTSLQDCHTNNASVNINAKANKWEEEINDSSSDEGEDAVNWEDADAVEEENCDGGKDKGGGKQDEDVENNEKSGKCVSNTSSAVARPLQAVVIDFLDSTNNLDDDPGEHQAKRTSSLPKKQQKQKRQRKKRWRATSLPPNLRSLLHQLQQSQLLLLTCRAAHVSSICADETVKAVAHSLVPSRFLVTPATTASAKPSYKAPSLQELRDFCHHWFFDMIHCTDERRRQRHTANLAAGAPASSTARLRRGSSKRVINKKTKHEDNNRKSKNATSASSNANNAYLVSSTTRLMEYCSHLSPINDEDPQLVAEEQEAGVLDYGYGRDHEKNQLLVATARSLGWRARYVQAMDPMTTDLNEDHPLLATYRNAFQTLLFGGHNGDTSSNNGGDCKPTASKGKKRKRDKEGKEARVTNIEPEVSTTTRASGRMGHSGNCSGNIMNSRGEQETDDPGGGVCGYWVEILCADLSAKNKHRWVHVDPVRQLVDRPDQVEDFLLSPTPLSSSGYSAKSISKMRNRWGSSKAKVKVAIAYALAVEHYEKTKISSSKQQNNPTQLENGDGMFKATPVFESSTSVRWTDVTPRYAKSWVASLRKRGLAHGKKSMLVFANSDKNSGEHSQQQPRDRHWNETWWTQTIHFLNRKNPKRPPCGSPAAPRRSSTNNGNFVNTGLSQEDAIVLDDGSSSDGNNLIEAAAKAADPLIEEEENDEDELVQHECEELKESAANDVLPTSKAAFQSHPLYALASLLSTAEVLAPDASKRICGVFKGEMVYRRADVSTALAENKWPYQGRKVLSVERSRPIKRIKAKKKSSPSGFKALKSYGFGGTNDGSLEQRRNQIERAEERDHDGMQDVYAYWQTEPWSPAPVGPQDTMPVNEYGNIELALINPGLVHLDQRGMAPVAKKLGIPYAPCLLGFEGGGRSRKPTIRGIVVHNHNEVLLREAHTEAWQYAQDEAHARRQAELYQKWKKLLTGLLIKDRLEREYGDNGDCIGGDGKADNLDRIK